MARRSPSPAATRATADPGPGAARRRRARRRERDRVAQHAQARRRSSGSRRCRSTTTSPTRTTSSTAWSTSSSARSSCPPATSTGRRPCAGGPISAREVLSPPPLGDRPDGVADHARPRDAAPPRRRARQPARGRLLDRDGRARVLRSSTATSTASRCRRRACRSRPPRRPRRWRSRSCAQFPADEYPHLTELTRRARPAARLRLRRRVRVRARPDPRRPRAGCPMTFPDWIVMSRPDALVFH